MKKIYGLVVVFFVLTQLTKAQDTLMFQDFEFKSFFDNTLVIDVPPGEAADTKWYSWDADDLPDASGSSTPRAKGWFAVRPFSDVDYYETKYSTPSARDSNTVIGANSWTGGIIPQNNWLITSNVQLGEHDTLFWKSSPLQTPRYCDGYQIRLSTTNNSDNTAPGYFSNLLFTAAEMVGTPATDPDTVYANFTFAPSNAFIHGQDGSFIDNASTSAPVSHKGRLRQFSVPLDAYANQNVFIAIIHNSTDDNMIAFDDIMIRGTKPTIGITENAAIDLNLNVFPNPSSDMVQVNYNLSKASTITMSLFDLTGKLVMTESQGKQTEGRHFVHINTRNLPQGFYTIRVETDFGVNTTKLIVN